MSWDGGSASAGQSTVNSAAQLAMRVGRGKYKCRPVNCKQCGIENLPYNFGLEAQFALRSSNLTRLHGQIKTSGHPCLCLIFSIQNVQSINLEFNVRTLCFLTLNTL